MPSFNSRRFYTTFVTAFAFIAIFLINTQQASAATFQMQTGYYVGDGADNRAITGIGFTPQLIIIKDDTGNGSLGAVWKSSSMSGETTALLADATADITTDAIQSLDSNGFTLGTNADVNAANVRFTWVAFSGSDCTSSGTFCVGTYTGDGNSTHALTSTGFTPSLVVIKGSSTTTAAYKSASMPTNDSQSFSSANEVSDGTVFKTLDSTGFTVGNATRVNSSSTNYWFFAFKTTSNAFSEGSFTGDGLDNKAITAPGYKPNYVWLKNANATTPIRTEFNLTETNGDYSGTFSDSNNTTGEIKSLDSTGFTVGTAASANESGKTLYWMAFGGASTPSGSGTYSMKVGSFTGTGSAQSITGIGFTPDLVIIKDSTAASHAVFRTTLMKGDSTAYFGNTAVNFTGGITSLDSGGFTLGTDATVNSSAVVYYYQAFGGAFNPEKNTGASDFTIGAYTGAAIDNRNILRQPFQPDLVAIKPNSAASGMWRTSDETGDASIGFSGVSESTDNIQALNSDGFQVGTSTRVNGGTTTVFNFFSFKAGSTLVVNHYSGTGSAQNITSVGFSPDLLWVKSTGGANAVFRPSTISTNSTLFFPASIAVADRITAFLSNGFSIGGNQIETNTSATTYRYAAWKINATPSTPSLDSPPADGATGISLTPSLKTTGSDTESDYLRYKIELCTDALMTTSCQTFNQVSSQTGWSGQNAQTSTAYTSGTQATYTIQSALSAGTTYYWRSYAIDPGGSNTFSSTQTPHSFTTLAVPAAPSSFTGTAVSTTSITWSFTDNASTENGFLVQDTGNTTKCTVASASSGTSSTVTCTETGLTANTSYTRKAVAYNDAGNSTASSTATVSTLTGTVTLPYEFNLDSPGNNSYTNSERPTFRWNVPQSAISGVSFYSLEVDNGDTGDFSLTNIPVNRNSDYETNTYVAHYDGFSDADNGNNYINVYTKSSSEWSTDTNSGNNDGKLKEGKRIWRVKARDSGGNTREEARTLYVDRNGPSLTISRVNALSYNSAHPNIVTIDRTPVLTGTLTDTLAGDTTGNAVVSGPKNVAVKIERKNSFGIFELYSITNITIPFAYWSNSGNKVTDNSQNTANKYADFEYSSTENLPFGIYRVTLTGKDTADNNSSDTVFTLTIQNTSIPQSTPVAINEPVIDVFPESTPVVTPKPTASPQITAEVIPTATPRPTPEPINKISFRQSFVNFFVNIVHFFGNVGTYIADVARQGKTDLAAVFKAPRDFGGKVGEWIAYSVGSFKEIVLDSSPTQISEVKVDQSTATSMIITWKTNHLATSKVNYGLSRDYGQDVQSDNRVRDHRVEITGLTPGTRYNYEVMSQGKNYVYDANHEFETPLN